MIKKFRIFEEGEYKDINKDDNVILLKLSDKRFDKFFQEGGIYRIGKVDYNDMDLRYLLLDKDNEPYWVNELDIVLATPDNIEEWHANINANKYNL